MKSVLSKLKEYSGESFDLLDFGKLSQHYASDIKAAEERDEARMRSYYEPDNTMDKLSMLREKLAERVEEEASEIDGDLPVVSTFDLHNAVKQAMTADKRDVGLKALYAHVKKLWEKNRTGSVDYATFAEIRDHYSARFPKSAAVDCLENSAANGYVKLDMTKLMGIAASIHDQDDFDYMMRVNGLSVNNPQNKKARDFIIEMVNKRAQMEGWDPEQYAEWDSPEEESTQDDLDWALVDAVKDMDLGAAKRYLDRGADPSANGAEAFMTMFKMQDASQGSYPYPFDKFVSLFEEYGYSMAGFEEVYGKTGSSDKKAQGWDADWDDEDGAEEGPPSIEIAHKTPEGDVSSFWLDLSDMSLEEVQSKIDEVDGSIYDASGFGEYDSIEDQPLEVIMQAVEAIKEFGVEDYIERAEYL
jgi:hypothetical protein